MPPTTAATNGQRAVKHYSVRGHRFTIPDRYELQRDLGSGAFGIVCSATDTQSGRMVAIKKVDGAFRNSEAAKKIVRELRLLKHFAGHPNIIRLLDVLEPESPEYNEIYFVTDLLNTDLKKVLRGAQLDFDVVQSLLSQLLTGVETIHRANVLHRDLKPENIFVNNDGTLKIGDFGLARDGHHTQMSEYVVTRWYRSPELVVSRARYGRGIDIWSVGCIFAEMMSRGRGVLFDGSNTLDQLNRILYVLGTPSSEDCWFVGEKPRKYIASRSEVRKDLRQPYSRTPKEEKPYLPAGVSAEALDFLDKTLVFDPRKRASAAELLKHPFLGEYAYNIEEEEEEEEGEEEEGVYHPSPFDPAFEDHMESAEEARKIANAIIAAYSPEFASRPGVVLHNKVTAETALAEGNKQDTVYDAAAKDAENLSSQVYDLLEALASPQSVDIPTLHSATSAALASCDRTSIEECIRSSGLSWDDGSSSFLSTPTPDALNTFRTAVERVVEEAERGACAEAGVNMSPTAF